MLFILVYTGLDTGSHATPPLRQRLYETDTHTNTRANTNASTNISTRSGTKKYAKQTIIAIRVRRTTIIATSIITIITVAVGITITTIRIATMQ